MCRRTEGLKLVSKIINLQTHLHVALTFFHPSNCFISVSKEVFPYFSIQVFKLKLVYPV